MQKALKWLPVLFAAGAVFALARYSPLVNDDYFCLYKNTPGTPFFALDFGRAERILTLTDVAESVRNMYFDWSGRIFYLSTVKTFLMFDKIWYDLVNAGFTAAAIVLAVRIAMGRRPAPVWLIAAAAGLFLLCAPAPGQTLVWGSGTVCYLWPACFYLFLLWRYRDILEYGIPGHGGLFACPLLFITGMIAGNANENTAGAVILTAAAMMLMIKKKCGKIPPRLWCGIAGLAAGLALMLSAPGLRCRIAYEHHCFRGFFYGAALQTAYLFSLIPGLFPLNAGLLWILFRRREADLKLPLLFICTGLAACYVMALSPYAPGRAVFGCFILMLPASLMLLERLDAPDLQKVFAATIFCAGLAAAGLGLRDSVYTFQAHRKRLADCREEAVVAPVIGTSRYNVLYKTDVLRDNSGHFINRHFAAEYGLKSVRTADMPFISGMK